MLKDKKRLIILLGLLILGLMVRIFFVDKFITVSGDLNLIADWGEKYWVYGTRGFYTGETLGIVNYPPLMLYLYSFAAHIYSKRYILLLIDKNFPLFPSDLIIYFYQNGYIFLLKLPAILADLSLGALIYKITLELKKNKNFALLIAALYVLNPVSIFISSVWGQSDALIALFGLLSFYALYKGKTHLSIPLYFVSLYLKPQWIFFAPIYIFILIVNRFEIKKVMIGIFAISVIFFISTYPFAGNNIIDFTLWLFKERFYSIATLGQKASVSAFNFYTIFYQIDNTLNTQKLLLLKLEEWGILCWILLNLISMLYLVNKNFRFQAYLVSIFTVGLGTFLFMTGMLERYFFSALIPLLIIMFENRETLKWGIIINIILFINILYAFFRRSQPWLFELFSKENYFIIRFLSLTIVISYLILVKKFIQPYILFKEHIEDMMQVHMRNFSKNKFKLLSKN